MERGKQKHLQPGRYAGAIVSIATALWLATGSISAFAANPDDPQKLADQAAESNNGVAAVKGQVESLRYQLDAADVWADPVFSVEYSNFPVDTFSMGDSPMTGIQFKLQQTLPLPGKNSRREESARLQYQASRHELDERINQLKGLVKRSYWNLALVRNLRKVTVEHIDLVEDLIESVRSAYRVGRGAQHDLLRLKVLKEKLTDDLADFQRKERKLVAAINSALSRPVDTEIVTPESAPVQRPEVGLDELIEAARQSRPLLAQLEQKAAAHRAMAAETGLDRYPDVSVWAGYRIREPAGTDDGTDQMSVGMAVGLPFDYSGRFSARTDSQLSQADSTVSQRKAALDEIASGIADALAGWQRAAERYYTYKDSLLPDARQSYQATLSAYQTDKAGFASLYDAQLQVLQFDRVVLSSATEAANSRIAIETLIGKPLEKVSAQGEGDE